MKSWDQAPSFQKPTEWQPGEKRAYIPVLTFGRASNVPSEGQVGRIKEVQGQTTVREVKHGKRTLGTKKP